MMGGVPADKPRHLQTSRDMIYTIIPLVLIVLALAGLSKACSFSPGGPSAGAPPSVDVTAALSAGARTANFPLRLPALPAGWVSNSGNRHTVAGAQGGVVEDTGWISPKGSYLRLAQSSAGEDALMSDEVGSMRKASGTTSAGGRDWVVYSQQDAEAVWVANLGDVRILITGGGGAEEFQTLATATVQAVPLQH
jgi:hypothetical protein